MKVRMTARVSGTRDGAVWPDAGEMIDVPAEEAAQLISSRLAIAVTPETAAVIAGENPEEKRGPGRPRKVV